MTEDNTSTGALVLGILSLIFWLIPPAGLPIGIIGVVLGRRRMKEKRRFSKGAFICSIIGLSLTIIHAAISIYLGPSFYVF